jgi:hypothetical protein
MKIKKPQWQLRLSGSREVLATKYIDTDTFLRERQEVVR